MTAQPLDARMARIEGAFEQIDKRLDAFERRVDASFGQIESRLTWLTGILVGTWITTILTILFHK